MAVSSEKKLPISAIRRGLITASIWANDSERGLRYAVTLDRRYRSAEGDWRSTQSLDRDSLLLAADMLRDAAKFIYDAEEGRRQERRSAEPVQEAVQAPHDEGGEFTDEIPF